MSQKKNKRRSNGEGSIRQEKNGRWIGQLVVGYKSDGSPMRKTKRADSKKEVMAWMDKLKHEILITGYKQTAEINQFDLLYKRWFMQYYSHAGDTYRQALIQRSNKFFNFFGDIEVGKITKEFATIFFNNELENCQRDTVKRLQDMLNNFFDYCQENDYIIKHPTKSIKLKGGNYSNNQKEKRKPLTYDEIEKVEEMLENADVRDKAILTFLLHTGVRPGEIRASRWSDIKNGCLHIVEAVRRKVEFEADGWTEKRTYEQVALPKGSRDDIIRTRAIPISQKLEDVLEKWKEYQVENEYNNPYNLIFPMIDPRRNREGNYYTYSGFKGLWVRILKRHGLEDLGRCIYATRHTFATKLHDKGVPIGHISSVMGHRKISTTTDVYIGNAELDASKITITSGLRDVFGEVS